MGGNRKIVVPEGMLQSVLIEGDRTDWAVHYNVAESILGAVLRWLATHPIVPGDSDINSWYSQQSEAGASFDLIRKAMVDWQVNMFLSPKPKTEIDIDDLLWINGRYNIEGEDSWPEPIPSEAIHHHNKAVLNAYRLGRQSRDEESK